jgi:hypothetical protein
MADAAGIPIIFLVLQDSPVHASTLIQGREHLARGDRNTGLRYLEQASDGGAFKELARIELAEALRSGGDSAGADARVELTIYRTIYDGHAVLPDGHAVLRPDWVYAQIMSEVAGVTSATLVDVRDILSANPGDFIDLCHFNPESHEKVGVRLAVTIRELLGDGAAAGGGSLSGQGWDPTESAQDGT